MRIGVITLVCGIAIGAGLFFAIFRMPSLDYALRNVNTDRYVGVVSTMDVQNKTLTIFVRDRYPLSYGEPRLVRFSYDDTTIWASFEYQLKDDMVLYRKTRAEAARSLPSGTKVTLVTRGEGLRIGALVFLRRTLL